jgi:hypothetical protein
MAIVEYLVAPTAEDWNGERYLVDDVVIEMARKNGDPNCAQHHSDEGTQCNCAAEDCAREEVTVYLNIQT